MSEPSQESADDSSLRTRVERAMPAHVATRAFIIMWVAMATFSLFVEPALAQNACDDQILTTVTNATTWLTVAGPTIGSANAGYNMLKASGTNKSGNKKEYKENIRDSLMYGFGLGMLTGIVNLITQWGPMAAC